MEINVNQKCTVILLKRGVEALEEYYSNLLMPMPDEYKPGDEYTSELWNIMSIFGRFMSHGAEPPFETNINIK